MSDLFGFFDQVNNENYDYVDDLDDEAVKKLAPYVILHWMYGASSNKEIHTLLTDMYCNPYVFSLSKHPRLLLKLMIAANGGIDQSRYKFIKPSRRSSDRATIAIARYYCVGYTDAEDYAKILSDGEIERIVDIVESKDV